MTAIGMTVGVLAVLALIAGAVIVMTIVTILAGAVMMIAALIGILLRAIAETAMIGARIAGRVGATMMTMMTAANDLVGREIVRIARMIEVGIETGIDTTKGTRRRETKTTGDDMS